MEFLVQRHLAPPDAFVLVRGELDLATVRDFERQLAEVRALGCHHVLLDVGGVTFIDCASARTIAVAQQSLAECGGSLAVVRAPDRFRRLCRLARFDELTRACCAAAEAPPA